MSGTKVNPIICVKNTAHLQYLTLIFYWTIWVARENYQLYVKNKDIKDSMGAFVKLKWSEINVSNSFWILKLWFQLVRLAYSLTTNPEPMPCEWRGWVRSTQNLTLNNFILCVSSWSLMKCAMGKKLDNSVREKGCRKDSKLCQLILRQMKAA